MFSSVQWFLNWISHNFQKVNNIFSKRWDYNAVDSLVSFLENSAFEKTAVLLTRLIIQYFTSTKVRFKYFTFLED